MKFISLVLANFRRHKTRTLLTVLSILVAFVLFGYLAAIRKAFELGVSVAGADRLVVRHKVSLIQLLPANYEAQIEQVAGVENATHATWFGGVYQEPKNFFPQMAVNYEEWVKIFPEYAVSPEQQAAWGQTRTGAIVGRKLADRFGFKVGDKIPLKATIWRPKSGGSLWTFDVVGIYEGVGKDTDTSQLFFRQDYLEESRTGGSGQIGWYHIKVSNPKVAEEAAKRIDEKFANSPAETKTETEGAFVKAFADQIGNIGAIVTAILTAVFFTILLVAGNTMAQSVRERMSELGVLKAIGFTDPQVLLLILAESVLIAIVGGTLGLFLGWMLVSAGDPTNGALPIFYFPPEAIALGAGLVLLLGIVTGLLPGLQAMRLNAVDALRRE